MTRRFSARLTAVIILLAVLVLGFSPAANATPSIAPTSASVATAVPMANACPTAGSNAGPTSQLLPVNRWGDATSNMHSRMGNEWLSDTSELIQRNQIIGGGMAMGNFMWGLGTDMSAFAIQFCMLDSMGGAADQVVSKFGKVLLQPQNGLLTLLLVLGVVGLLLQGARRGSMPWKKIAGKGVIVAFIAVMIFGATNSTGGGITDASGKASTAEYKPGVGSPGWFVGTLNTTVASLASAPAAALSLETGKEAGAGSNPLSCAVYTQEMRKAYRDKFKPGPSSMSSGIPLIMSSMWEDTGLTTWKSAQFGSQDGFSDQAWCRLLEWNASSRLTANQASTDEFGSGSSVRSIMHRAMGAPAIQTDYNAPAFTVNDSVATDRSLIAWSACQLVPSTANPNDQGSWQVRDAFATGDSENKIEPGNCHQWWTKSADGLGNFDWPDNAGDISDRTMGNHDLREYVMTLHGNSNAQGMTAVFAYNLSALCMLIVFGGISLAIIFAKIAMVIMIIVVLVQALMLLLPNGEMGKLVGPMKMVLGLSIFTFGVQLIFSLMSVITRMLQTSATGLLGGSGNLFAILWTGLSPVLACVVLHMMFTKVLKVPSPFKLSSGLAWGTAAAAAGGAATAGVSNMLDRSQSKLTNRAKSAGQGGVRSLKSGANRGLAAATGGRLGTRKGSAIPGAAAAGAAGAAAGAAAAGSQGGRKGRASAPGSAVSAAMGKEGAASSPAEGGAHHSMLAGSNVANSQLDRGHMDASERKVLKQLKADEVEAAKEHKVQRDAELGIERPATAMGHARSTVRTSLQNVREDFRAKPLKTTAKVAAGAALVTLATPSVLALPAVAAVGAAGYAAKHGGKALHRKYSRSYLDQTVNDYRQHQMRSKKSQENEPQVESTTVSGGSSGGGTPSEGRGTTVEQERGGARNDAAGKKAERPAQPLDTPTDSLPVVTESNPAQPQTRRQARASNGQGPVMEHAAAGRNPVANQARESINTTTIDV